MKSLFLALLLLPSLASALEPAWLQERLISAPVSENLQGRGQTLSLRNYLQIPRGSRVNDLIITAATAAGRGRLEVLLDGRSLNQVVVDRALKAITIPLNTMISPRSDLQIRVEGNFYIAQVAVTVALNMGPGPGPGPGPFPPPPFDNSRQCQDFTFAEYKAEGYNNSDSLNLSTQFCQTNQDIFQNRVMFDRFYGLLRAEGYTRRDSLTLTAEYIHKNLSAIQYREESYTWVFDRLREEGYTRRDSMNLTVEILGRFHDQNVGCIRQRFDLFRQDGYTRRDSISKAIETCQR